MRNSLKSCGLKFSIFFLSVFAAFFYTNFLYSQKLSDTIHLKPVDIVTSIKGNTSYKQQSIDSIVLANSITANLSDLLSQNTSVFIKSYGFGSLASPSLRGTSANHTLVEWNGIQLNSPVNGQVDFSSIPAGAFDKLELKYGNSSFSENSGAFGGMVQLSTQPDYGNKVCLSLSQFYSTLDNWSTVAVIKLGSLKFQSITRISNVNESNTFSYVNYLLQNKLSEQTKNNLFRQKGIIQELYWLLTDKQEFSVKLWYSNNYHEIPQIMNTQDQHHFSTQFDENFYAVSQWLYKPNSKTVYENNLNYSYTLIHYKDSLSSTDDTHFINTLSEKFTFHRKSILRHVNISGSADYQYNTVVSDNFNGKKERQIATVFGNINYHPLEKLFFDFQIRESYRDNSLCPSALSFAITYQPFNDIGLYLNPNVSTNYRFPTMNDLYWVPGGNPNLKSEKNYSTELNLRYKTKPTENKYIVNSSISFYYSDIDNMIVWAPLQATYFEPQNLKKVNSKGIEVLLSVAYKIKNYRFLLNGGYNYCRSINKTSTSINDNSVGKQLIYTPENSANASIRIEHAGFILSYRQQYVDKRYISSDNTSYLPDYTLGSLQITRQWKPNPFTVQLWIGIDNLFDEAYQSVAFRPMPGRFYEMGLKITFNKK